MLHLVMSNPARVKNHTVELLYWEGCPSHGAAQALLEEILRERGVGAGLSVREITSIDEAEELRFPGSPTIRIDGLDVDPAGSEHPPSLTCRVYRLPDGRAWPLPTRALIEAALDR